MSKHERTGKAWRRHDRFRLKKKRGDYFYVRFWLECDPELKDKKLGRLVNTPKACSCACCGNPRKFFKALTKAEKVSNIKYKDMMREV